MPSSVPGVDVLRSALVLKRLQPPLVMTSTQAMTNEAVRFMKAMPDYGSAVESTAIRATFLRRTDVAQGRRRRRGCDRRHPRTGRAGAASDEAAEPVGFDAGAG